MHTGRQVAAPVNSSDIGKGDIQGQMKVKHWSEDG